AEREQPATGAVTPERYLLTRVGRGRVVRARGVIYAFGVRVDELLPGTVVDHLVDRVGDLLTLIGVLRDSHPVALLGEGVAHHSHVSPAGFGGERSEERRVGKHR